MLLLGRGANNQNGNFFWNWNLHIHIDQTWLQNLHQDLTSLPLQNISKILTKLQLQILPELQLQNLDQTLCSKSEQKFCFMTKSTTNCCQHDPHYQHQQQLQPQQVLSWSDSGLIRRTLDFPFAYISISPLCAPLVFCFCQFAPAPPRHYSVL